MARHRDQTARLTCRSGQGPWRAQGHRNAITGHGAVLVGQDELGCCFNHGFGTHHLETIEGLGHVVATGQVQQCRHIGAAPAHQRGPLPTGQDKQCFGSTRQLGHLRGHLVHVGSKFGHQPLAFGHFAQHGCDETNAALHTGRRLFAIDHIDLHTRRPQLIQGLRHHPLIADEQTCGRHRQHRFGRCLAKAWQTGHLGQLGQVVAAATHRHDLRCTAQSDHNFCHIAVGDNEPLCSGNRAGQQHQRQTNQGPASTQCRIPLEMLNRCRHLHVASSAWESTARACARRATAPYQA